VLIGKISTLFGTPAVADSPLGHFFAMIGADPVIVDKVPSNLTAAMLSVVPMMVLGCLFFLLGAKHLPEDMERARIERGGDEALADGFIAH
jgi:hypothetical protein